MVRILQKLKMSKSILKSAWGSTV